MVMRFVDKAVLVTGGSQGIGEAICRRFAAEGAKVAVVASSDKAKAQAVVDAIGQSGGTARAFACNVAAVAEIEALVAEVITVLGGIDILINSAGVFYPTPIGETDEAMFDRMCDINLKGCFFACNAVAPHMTARGSGKIVNIASTAGVIGRRDYVVYSATKAGVIHMGRAMAVALAPHGVNVNTIAPGNVETPMNEDIRTLPEFAPNWALIAERTPAKRLFAHRDEIAEAALFLASDAAMSMHGAVMVMDNGVTAGY
jgi:3-oxoacyl-[acyl-carrier protein] reductase